MSDALELGQALRDRGIDARFRVIVPDTPGPVVTLSPERMQTEWHFANYCRSESHTRAGLTHALSLASHGRSTASQTHVRGHAGKGLGSCESMGDPQRQ
jgi:hypothetical protein